MRRRRRAPAALRDRLLRRLHVPVGARRVPARHRQPDLLADRRPRAPAAPTTRARGRAVGEVLERPHPDDRGAARARAARREAGCACASRTPRSRRRSADAGRACRRWVDQDIHVEGRPEWVFVKVHTHGAPEAQAASLLGDGGRALHRELTTRYNDGKRLGAPLRDRARDVQHRDRGDGRQDGQSRRLQGSPPEAARPARADATDPPPNSTAGPGGRGSLAAPQPGPRRRSPRTSFRSA